MALSVGARLALLAASAALSRAGGARDKFHADSVLIASEDHADMANTQRRLQSEVPPRTDATSRSWDTEVHPGLISQLETRSSAHAESDEAAALSAPTTFKGGEYVKAVRTLFAQKVMNDHYFLIVKDSIGQVQLVGKDSIGQVQRVDTVDKVLVMWPTQGSLRGQGAYVSAQDLVEVSEKDYDTKAELAVDPTLEGGDHVKAVRDLKAEKATTLEFSDTFHVAKGSIGKVMWVATETVDKVPDKVFVVWPTQGEGVEGQGGYVSAKDLVKAYKADYDAKAEPAAAPADDGDDDA